MHPWVSGHPTQVPSEAPKIQASPIAPVQPGIAALLAEEEQAEKSVPLDEALGKSTGKRKPLKQGGGFALIKLQWGHWCRNLTKPGGLFQLRNAGGATEPLGWWETSVQGSSECWCHWWGAHVLLGTGGTPVREQGCQTRQENKKKPGK